jgi:hypothetical protein
MDRTLASHLRQKLRDLRSERERIETELLEARELIKGSLLKRELLAGGEVRGCPAHYVCVRREDGRNQFIYVRKVDLDRVRAHVEAYRCYRAGLRRLRRVAKEILGALQSLGEQLELPLER